MIETSDSNDEAVLDRLRETLDGAIRDPSHSLASMMTEAYRSLLRVAHVQRNTFGASPTLSTTALVHEVYLKPQESPELKVTDIHHFHYLAIRAMRFVLTDHARRKLAQKRGSAVPTETLDEHAGSDINDRHAEQVIELNEAIDQLGHAASIATFSIQVLGSLGDRDDLAALRGLCDRESYGVDALDAIKKIEARMNHR